jgi:hypothetical protein
VVPPSRGYVELCIALSQASVGGAAKLIAAHHRAIAPSSFPPFSTALRLAVKSAQPLFGRWDAILARVFCLTWKLPLEHALARQICRLPSRIPEEAHQFIVGERFAMREQSPIFDKPIFLDETGLRWRLVRIVLLGLIMTVLILPIVLTISILTVEVLPAQFTDLQQQVITASAPSYLMPSKRMNSRALYDSQIRAH